MHYLNWLGDCQLDLSCKSDRVELSELVLLQGVNRLEFMHSWNFYLLICYFPSSEDQLRADFVWTLEFQCRVLIQVFTHKLQVFGQCNSVFIFIEEGKSDQVETIFYQNVWFWGGRKAIAKKGLSKVRSSDSFELGFFIRNVSDLDIKSVGEHNADARLGRVVGHVPVLYQDTLLALCQMAGEGSVLINITQKDASDRPSIFFVRDRNRFFWYSAHIIHFEIWKTERKLASWQHEDCVLGLDHKRFNDRHFDFVWCDVLIAWLQHVHLNRSVAFFKTLDVKDIAAISSVVRITFWSCDHLDVGLTWNYGPLKPETFKPTEDISLVIERRNFDMASVIDVEVTVGR